MVNTVGYWSNFFYASVLPDIVGKKDCGHDKLDSVVSQSAVFLMMGGINLQNNQMPDLWIDAFNSDSW